MCYPPVGSQSGDFIKTVDTAKTQPGNEVTWATPAAIVVLGARVLPDGRPSGALERRMQVALALYRAGVAPILLLSGGGRGVPEAEVMREMAIAAGVPESALLIEARSRNTLENARNAAAMLGTLGAQVVLATDRYHAFRARVLFRLAGLTVCAVRGATLPSRQHLAMLTSEAVKLPISVLRALSQKAGRAIRG